jgi:hypothetical protein
MWLLEYSIRWIASIVYSSWAMAVPLILVLIFAAILSVALLVAPRARFAAAGAAVICLLIAAFSIFGFLASAEPGNDTVTWRIAYSTVFFFASAGLVRSLLLVFRPKRGN